MKTVGNVIITLLHGSLIMYTQYSILYTLYPMILGRPLSASDDVIQKNISLFFG